MNYTVEASEKSTVKITIKFDAAEWADANDKAYLKNKKKYAVNGFRKGKVPKNVLLNFYGKGLFYEEALNELYAEHYGAILEKEKENFTAVGEPSLSVDDLSDEGVSLVAVTPVKPDVEIQAYKGIKIKKYEYTVKDEDVEEELKKLQDRNARQVDVTDRAAANGDIANIDFVGKIGGEEFEGGSAEKFDLTLGSGQFIPGFEDQVVGMAIDEVKDIPVTFPEDYQAEDLKGKEAVFTVTLHSLKAKELPEVTDEFVKEAAACDTVEEYKTKARERLEKAAERKSRDETENSILDAIAEGAQCEIPQAMIDSQVDQIMQRVSYQMMNQGFQLEDYLQYTGMTMEKFRGQYAEQARKTVLNQLIIDKIIKTEGFGATDAEVDEKIAEQAKSVDKEFDAYKKDMDPRQVEYIKNDIIVNKLFRFLTENNELYVEE